MNALISSLQRKLRKKPSASARALVVDRSGATYRTSDSEYPGSDLVAPEAMNGTMPLLLNPYSSPADPLAESAAQTAKASSPLAKPAPLAEKQGGEKRFAFIDALRGLAALGVAAYHIYRYGPLPGPASTIVPKFLGVVMRHGWMGVQVFFVISGFVIAYVLRNAKIDRGYLRTFTIQRALRLGPPYWCTMLFVVALYTLTNALFIIEPSLLSEYPSWHQMAAHVFYLQNVLGYDNISVGFWTLCVEMQFYLLFALMLGFSQWLAARAPLAKLNSGTKWIPSIALLIVFAPLALASMFSFSLNSENTNWVFHFFAYFFLGAMIWWTMEGRLPKMLFWAFVAAALYRQHRHWTLDMNVALIAAVTIYVVGRLGHLGDWLNFRWLQYLGSISYSLYLIHYPISWIVGSIGFELTREAAVPAVIWLVLGLAASIGVAQVVHVTIELPAIRLARRYKEAHSGVRTIAAIEPVVATAAGR